MTGSNTVHAATERLVIRSVKPTDVESIFRLFSSEENVRYYPETVMTDIRQAGEMIERFIREEDEGLGMRLGIARKEDNVLIGLITADRFDYLNGLCRIKFLLHEKFRKKGYMSEALEQVLNSLALKKDINRFYSELSTDDGGSAKLLKSYGFLKEGIARSAVKAGEDSYRDAVIYAYVRK